MKIYLVGGAVRDKLMNKTPKDKDYVVVGATSEMMLENNFKPIEAEFPIFTKTNENGEIEEYALARLEKKVGKGYHGFITEHHENVTLEDDLKRRDLTINSIGFDEETQQYIDPFNGRQDIENKILRHTSEAFQEDPVRILRIARFNARMSDFNIADETIQFIFEMIKNGDLKDLTPERTLLELQKALSEKNSSIYFKILKNFNAFQYVYQELKDMIDNPQRIDYHFEGDVFKHTLLSLDEGDKLIREHNFSTEELIEIKFAILMHDIGKIKSSEDLKKEGKHYGHDNLDLVEPLLNNIKEKWLIPNDYYKLSLKTAVYHQKIHNIKLLKSKNIIKMFQFLGYQKNNYEKELLKFYLVCKADHFGHIRSTQIGKIGDNINIDNVILSDNNKIVDKTLYKIEKGKDIPYLEFEDLKKMYEIFLNVSPVEFIKKYENKYQQKPDGEKIKTFVLQERIKKLDEWRKNIQEQQYELMKN